MKKIKTIFLSLFVLVFLVGCGEKEQKLVCTNTENEDGIRIEQVISMTYQSDQLKHMTLEVNSTVTDTDVQENWEEYKKMMEKDNQEFHEEGMDFKVIINDQNYEYNTVLDIDIDKANEEALAEHGFEDLKEDMSTLEDSKKSATDDGFTCVIK